MPSKEYYWKHKEELLKKAAKYRLDNKERINFIRKSKRQYHIHSNIFSRCSTSGRWHYEKGIKCKITPTEIKILMDRDGYTNLKQPSIDRINPDLNYTLSNCRFIELSENCKNVRRHKQNE